MDGPCAGGEVGASYVRWPDGRRSVLTWMPDTAVADLRAGPFAVVDAVRAVGYPAPATELAVQIGSDVAIVQELLPGVKVDRLDLRGLEQVLELNTLQAGRFAGRDDVTAVNLYLSGDGPGFCLHEPLRRHSRRGAALERWVTSVAREYPECSNGDDAVHVDFHPGNMLARDGVITGVVDWDGAGRGDRSLDLVTLRFGVHAGGADQDVVRRLDAILDAMPRNALRPAWAHMSLRMADWAIRHHSPDSVEQWFDLAEQRV